MSLSLFILRRLDVPPLVPPPLEDFFFLGDFLRLLLKLPLRGNLTIHDGGTTIDL